MNQFTAKHSIIIVISTSEYLQKYTIILIH